MKALLLLCLLPQNPAGGAPAASAPEVLPARRIVYESVVALQGKTIGTTIMLEVADNGAVGGWIQRNDFFPIDSGHVDPDKIAFTSGGNQYNVNLRTMRINYSGPDGRGNQRVEKMTYVQGRVYRLTEEAMEERKITLQVDGSEKDYLIGQPAVWKRAGPPIDRFGRLEEVLGKTVGAWLARIAGTRYLAVLEEPEGMDLQKKAPKKEKEKKDKKKK